jgi:ParB family chromosome partitioning protein
MAREAARLLEGSNWLPEPLRQLGAKQVAVDDQDAAEINEEAAELPTYLAEAADAVAQDIVEAAE